MTTYSSEIENYLRFNEFDLPFRKWPNGSLYQLRLKPYKQADDMDYYKIPRLKFYKDSSMKGAVFAEVKDDGFYLLDKKVCNLKKWSKNYVHYEKFLTKRRGGLCEEAQFSGGHWTKPTLRVLNYDNGVVKVIVSNQEVYAKLEMDRVKEVLPPALEYLKKSLNKDKYIKLLSFIYSIKDLEYESIDELDTFFRKKLNCDSIFIGDNSIKRLFSEFKKSNINIPQTFSKFVLNPSFSKFFSLEKGMLVSLTVDYRIIPGLKSFKLEYGTIAIIYEQNKWCFSELDLANNH